MPHDFQADIDAVGRIDAVPMILDVVCRQTGMGFAAVARVTEDRWIACRVLDKIAFGLVPGAELEVKTTICDEIRASGEPVVIDHVEKDEVYCGHPTPAMYGFQSYISMPIVRKDGTVFGTLCAIDPKPAKLKTPETVGTFRLFADLIAFHLDAIERLDSAEATLVSERKMAELRDQFIAVLGHDLRNPVAAISAGVSMLNRSGTLDQKSQDITHQMQNSLVRAGRLIDNVLDFARGRLGGGMSLIRHAERPLAPVLEQVTDELRTVWPDRTIETSFAFSAPVDCDPDRIGQLYSNLLGNALTHGAEDGAVRAAVSLADGTFELSVANRGEPIPPAALEHIFEPFSRGEASPWRQGLGLGLYIASEIARAHGGTLSASSTAQETRFTFRMRLAT